MKKEDVIKPMKNPSRNFELERLSEKLDFIGKVEKGIIQLEHDITILHDEVKKIVKQW